MRSARQHYALTHPAEGGMPSDRLRTATRIDRGAHLLVVILAVDR
jgi:hypothetical protein